MTSESACPKKESASNCEKAIRDKANLFFEPVMILTITTDDEMRITEPLITIARS